MQRTIFSQRYFTFPDAVILGLLAIILYGVVAIGREGRADFHPITQIDLSVSALPYYTLLSGIRGAVAYIISLGFTLIVGYAAAKSRAAEKVIIPLLDILQSIPVLGFLPGLLLGLVAVFPDTNTGLELAAIIMIFTGQVWNLTFSYYSSLKSIPLDLQEASTVMGLGWKEKLIKLELPFSGVNLVWNSLLSMAGGWFFLIPCEAMTLGDREYRLPGIGAYMDVAVKQGDVQAIVSAVIAMVLLIVIMDFFIWRPILSWVQKFRLEQSTSSQVSEPLMQLWIRESKIVRAIKIFYRHSMLKNRNKFSHLKRKESSFFRVTRTKNERGRKIRSDRWIRLVEAILVVSVILLGGYGVFKLFTLLRQVTFVTWLMLLRNTFWTFIRVFLALLISTLWAVPVGIWIGTSPKRIRFAQPIIQVLASFPAPMLYPIALGAFFALKMSFDWAAMFLMLLGVQWYVLFNVLAGALRIPLELNYALALMKASRWDRWKTLYLPSVFPALVTGWVTAAGGAWNASVVAEYIFFRGSILKTGGLGATLSVATASGDFTLFAASLTLMVVFVIFLNRFVWARIYHLAQTRFRMDA